MVKEKNYNQLIKTFREKYTEFILNQNYNTTKILFIVRNSLNLNKLVVTRNTFL